MRSERLEPQGGVVFSTIFSVISPTKRRPIFDQKRPHLHSHWAPENQDMKWSRNLASRIVRGDRLGWLLPSQVVFLGDENSQKRWHSALRDICFHILCTSFFWGGEGDISDILSNHRPISWFLSNVVKHEVFQSTLVMCLGSSTVECLGLRRIPEARRKMGMTPCATLKARVIFYGRHQLGGGFQLFFIFTRPPFGEDSHSD